MYQLTITSTVLISKEKGTSEGVVAQLVLLGYSFMLRLGYIGYTGYT